MKKIVFSDHALLKIEVLRNHGILIDKAFIKDVINEPEQAGKGHREGRIVAQKTLDKDHVLRVIYEEQSNQILVITAYPGRRGRYAKNKIQ